MVKDLPIYLSMHILLGEVTIYDHIKWHLFGPRRKKTCLRGVGNNKGADQPAHQCSLISAFVIRFLESIISRLATSKISNSR